MDVLTQQLNDLEAQKAQLFEQDTIDHGEVGRVNDQIKAVQAQIDALNATAQREAIIESHVSQEISFAIAGVDLTDLPVQVVNLVSLIVRSERKQSAKANLDALDEKDSTHQEEKAAMLGTIAEQNQVTEDLRGIISVGKADNARLVNENGNLRDHIAQVNLDVEDLRSKLANAAAQLDEKDAAIKQLTSQIDDYQRAKVYGEVAAQKIIDITPESSEANDISAAVAALKTYISVENWGSVNKVVKEDGSFELVKNTELEKDWVPAEATTFPEAAETIAQDNQLPVTESAIAPPALPSETALPNLDTTVGGIATDTAVETVTRQEFEELKQRVAKMEAA